MSELLPNYLAGQWQSGDGPGTPLFDPVLGTELVRVSSSGLDLQGGYAYARDEGGGALRALTYAQRAGMLAAVVDVLKANRDRYFEIALANSGTTRQDSAVDIDGAIFTLGQYARWGAALGDTRWMGDGDTVPLAKDGSFRSRHVLVPTRGLALFINAFNFPAWGLWEKAAPALLSGVPVVVKPATTTAWLTHAMVADVVAAGVLPAGALSIVCGSARGLLSPLQPFDVVSFTGSADTAATIRADDAIVRRSVRVNIEADSLNSALLLPDAGPGSAAFELLVAEVVREMTVKSGQKCTAIRRVFVPASCYASAGEAIAAALAQVTVGNPRNSTVRMGALASRQQWEGVHAGIAKLRRHTEVLYDGTSAPLVDADPAVAACMGPTLLGGSRPDEAAVVHDTEVFGPVATLLPYDDLEDAVRQVRLGQGSLVTSIYTQDAGQAAQAALELADGHGRLHVITPEVGAAHTGHGNVMPMSLHGGPGRAGGGEELGGLRALQFYHRRAAIQASAPVLDALEAAREAHGTAD
ncbi:MAG: 3,4-dehydroadipyl-CoA semialdehyde dehydrogenase [Pigmentiphaga sp.]|uniref:3,4-dehydroadipyl-CoA semialdehyde dehydrogenase n=1 Tax=Pigmentiphaga sp. TaxID=1977564 RepID=UPI0029AE200B|nr:3,4-dehydroadipyl-CoA semialdehyde dehydrogenase [Pigmentiphaga sp.]MDX3907245.1 3,4-dehydroadipyl-CoA semialdehyde dehydrogenase [Pigmentiphaga sp.]